MDSGGKRPTNFYYRQNIVGLLRNLAQGLPELSDRSLEAAKHIDRTPTVPWLEEALSLFEEASIRCLSTIYLTGAYYAVQALREVTDWESQAGAQVETLMSAEGRSEAKFGAPADDHDRLAVEVEADLLEIFTRIRAGATLEEALALYPSLGEESAPES